jgi:hypothetical protein
VLRATTRHPPVARLPPPHKRPTPTLPATTLSLPVPSRERTTEREELAATRVAAAPITPEEEEGCRRRLPGLRALVALALRAWVVPVRPPFPFLVLCSLRLRFSSSSLYSLSLNLPTTKLTFLPPFDSFPLGRRRFFLPASRRRRRNGSLQLSRRFSRRRFEAGKHVGGSDGRCVRQHGALFVRSGRRNGKECVEGESQRSFVGNGGGVLGGRGVVVEGEGACSPFLSSPVLIAERSEDKRNSIETVVVTRCGTMSVDFYGGWAREGERENR